ncbi:MAG: hypothetical protein GPOALKHO_000928 [Sodalis sp.]|nr:MAG: hypothetical protein GPOALKHO_000928 [Sodalis sp.]
MCLRIVHTERLVIKVNKPNGALNPKAAAIARICRDSPRLTRCCHSTDGGKQGTMLTLCQSYAIKPLPVHFV